MVQQGLTRALGLTQAVVPVAMSAKFREDIADVVRNRLPEQFCAPWDMWVHEKPPNVVLCFWYMPQSLCCWEPSIGQEQVAVFCSFMLSWLAVITAQPHQQPVPSQFTSAPLMTVTAVDLVPKALYASTLSIHTSGVAENYWMTLFCVGRQLPPSQDFSAIPQPTHTHSAVMDSVAV